mgnify:CR=1 FL=1
MAELTLRMKELVQPYLAGIEPYDPNFTPTRINLSANENTYPVPNGMSYNNYLIMDEKTCLLDGVDDAVLDMVLQNDFADIIDGRAHGGDLNENLRAVAPVFYHFLDRFQMADGAGKAV